jgi:hypothetical protein
MSSKDSPIKSGRKRSQDQTSIPSTPTSTAIASPSSQNKQRKPTPSELTILFYNSVAVVIMAVNAYP